MTTFNEWNIDFRTNIIYYNGATKITIRNMYSTLCTMFDTVEYMAMPVPCIAYTNELVEILPPYTLNEYTFKWLLEGTIIQGGNTIWTQRNDNIQKIRMG